MYVLFVFCDSTKFLYRENVKLLLFCSALLLFLFVFPDIAYFRGPLIEAL